MNTEDSRPLDNSYCTCTIWDMHFFYSIKRVHLFKGYDGESRLILKVTFNFCLESENIVLYLFFAIISGFSFSFVLVKHFKDEGKLVKFFMVG